MSLQLQFFGATGEVTGSLYALRTGTHTVLLECGLIQGGAENEERNRQEFPVDIAEGPVLLVDPMLATGGSASQAITELKKEQCRDITMICLVCAPEGVKLMLEDHPDITIFAAGLDRQRSRRYRKRGEQRRADHRPQHLECLLERAAFDESEQRASAAGADTAQTVARTGAGLAAAADRAANRRAARSRSGKILLRQLPPAH